MDMIKFYDETLRGYFPTETQLKAVDVSKASFPKKMEVARHCCDTSWIGRYVLNCIYDDFNDSMIIFGVHTFLSTPEYAKIISDFQKLIVKVELDKLLERDVQKSLWSDPDYMYCKICEYVIDSTKNYYNMNKMVAFKIMEEFKPQILNMYKKAKDNSEIILEN